jgi:hypothetical protein
MAHLLSVNVGLPRDIAWRGKTVHTAIWKAPVQGSRVVRRLNIDGDGAVVEQGRVLWIALYGCTVFSGRRSKITIPGEGDRAVQMATFVIVFRAPEKVLRKKT